MNRIEDINLPNSIVGRLIKDAIPENVNLSKEARGVIARSASIFIIYLTSTSTTLARQNKLKTINTKNILDALNVLDLESFVAPIEHDLEAYRAMMKSKKDNKIIKKDAKENTKTNDENGNEEINEDEEETEVDVEMDNLSDQAKSNGYSEVDKETE